MRCAKTVAESGGRTELIEPAKGSIESNQELPFHIKVIKYHKQKKRQHRCEPQITNFHTSTFNNLRWC